MKLNLKSKCIFTIMNKKTELSYNNNFYSSNSTKVFKCALQIVSIKQYM